MRHLRIGIFIYLILIPNMFIKGQGIGKRVAIIETKEDPACKCPSVYSVFHKKLWDSKVYDKQLYYTLWEQYNESGNEESFNQYIDRYKISYFLINELKKDSLTNKTQIISKIFDSSGNEFYQFNSLVSVTSEAGKYGDQINKELKFFKENGHIMETLIVEDFEASTGYEIHNTKFPVWLYNYLKTNPITKNIARYERAHGDSAKPSKIDGQITPYPTDSVEYIKVDLIIYIRAKSIPIDQAIYLKGTYEISEKSKAYWAALIDLISKKLTKK